MTTQKHTPGPWKSDPYGIVTGGPHYLTSICDAYAFAWAKRQSQLPVESTEVSQWLDAMYQEATANARLIASAPALLEALEDCVKQLDAETLGGEALDKARAAIALARGQ